MNTATMELIRNARNATRQAYYHHRRALEVYKIEYLKALADVKEAQHKLNDACPESFQYLQDYETYIDTWQENLNHAARHLEYMKGVIRETRTNYNRTIEEMKHYPKIN